jgi:hypothetical protein
MGHDDMYGPCDEDWLEIRENSKRFFLGGPRYLIKSIYKKK